MKRPLLLLILLPVLVSAVALAAPSNPPSPNSVPACAICITPNGSCWANYGVTCTPPQGGPQCTPQQAYCNCPGWAAATHMGPYDCPSDQPLSN